LTSIPIDRQNVALLDYNLCFIILKNINNSQMNTNRNFQNFFVFECHNQTAVYLL